MRRAVLLFTVMGAMLLVSGVALAQTTPQGPPDAGCPSAQSMGFVPFWGGARAAQTFTAQSTGKLTSAQALIAKNGGSKDVVMEIAAVDASGAPTNNVLASTTIPNSSIDTSNHLTTITGNFAPSDAAQVLAGQKYALILRTADTVQTVWWFRDGNPCPGNLYLDFGSGWSGSAFTGQSDWDAVFSTYVTPTPPPNDNFADAQEISGDNASVSGTTKLATRETGEPDHYTPVPGDVDWTGDHSVWYRWTAPFSGSTTIDTCQANIDSILAVYTGGQIGSLTRIIDNNNGCSSGWGSKVTFDATAGTTYDIAVADAGGARENTFTLKLALTDDVAPTVSDINPADGATKVSRSTNAVATFSEAMDPTTIDASTFTLVNAKTGASVAGTVRVSSDGKTVTLDPSVAKLGKKTKYTATIEGGSSGVKDQAGNPLAADKVWSFTTGRK